jgi:heme oxygenase
VLEAEPPELPSPAGASAAKAGLTERPKTNAIIATADIAFLTQPILPTAIEHLLLRLFTAALFNLLTRATKLWFLPTAHSFALASKGL